MKTKHTQGEWIHQATSKEYYDSLIKNMGISRIKICYQTEKVLSVLGYFEFNPKTSFKEAEANAKLMASAPELLEALCKIRDILIRKEETDVNFIIEAIKKATS